MHSKISKWAHRYEALGESAFDSSSTNKKYSKDFKLKVIKEYLNGTISIYDLINKYNIPGKTIVLNWVKKYNEGIEIKDYDPKSEVYTMKARKTTFDERIEIINYVLANNNDYKGAADKYSVPYASVYQWVLKYNKDGQQALHDKRGRPSIKVPEHELSELERKDIEIEKLKRELERERMVNEVLKKNIEIQERMERNSRLLGKLTNMKQ